MGGISAVLYDNSNGLPTSEANAIAQTQNGFIWIGGYSGLVRYDGNIDGNYELHIKAFYEHAWFWIMMFALSLLLIFPDLNIDKDSLCEVLLKYHLCTIKSCVCKFAS